MNKPIKVRALTYHTFGGKEYNEGDTYEVAGDETQTAEQYAATLGLIKFAELDDGAKPEKQKQADEEGKQQYSTRELKAKK